MKNLDSVFERMQKHISPEKRKTIKEKIDEDLQAYQEIRRILWDIGHEGLPVDKKQIVMQAIEAYLDACIEIRQF